MIEHWVSDNLAVDQPRLEHKDGIVLGPRIYMWYEPEGTTFEMPLFTYENIKGWIHEFTESSLWCYLNTTPLHPVAPLKLYMRPHQHPSIYSTLRVVSRCELNTEKLRAKHYPCHIITALHTVSILSGELVDPDEYAEWLFKLYKTRPVDRI